jgi:hypothetical protein
MLPHHKTLRPEEEWVSNLKDTLTARAYIRTTKNHDQPVTFFEHFETERVEDGPRLVRR